MTINGQNESSTSPLVDGNPLNRNNVNETTLESEDDNPTSQNNVSENTDIEILEEGNQTLNTTSAAAENSSPSLQQNEMETLGDICEEEDDHPLNQNNINDPIPDVEMNLVETLTDDFAISNNEHGAVDENQGGSVVRVSNNTEDLTGESVASAVNVNNENLENNQNATDRENSPETDNAGGARNRWLRINQRFQMLLTLVTLFFSILLFCTLVCWVVFTSAFVMSIDRPCDVKLKMYFWLATMQLIIDLFRSDIMHYVLRFDARSQRSYPPQVLVYNLCYIVYAVLVLRLGVKSVFFSPNSKCRQTAPELFQTATVFISLSLGAWCTILFGYVLPFICVIVVLTRNGYAPTGDMAAWGNVFPTTQRGAPEGTIDMLTQVSPNEITETECIICMEEFEANDAIVMTECKHVFHKTCCQEWLLQSCTCPVCRTDITAPSGDSDNTRTSDNTLIAAEQGFAVSEITASR